MPQPIDITGQRFGRLTALHMTARNINEKPRRRERWLFNCECGREKEIAKHDVMSGRTSSCGCLLAETTRQRKTTHGHRARGKRTPEYEVWYGMHARCSDPDASGYKNYGGRGITVCERWNEFESFLADMGPKPSPKHEIDRIDNNGPYSPENCRWVTDVEQANNRRTNRFVTAEGRTQTLQQWAREVNISPFTLRGRINAGWDPEWALVPFPGMHFWEG